MRVIDGRTLAIVLSVPVGSLLVVLARIALLGRPFDPLRHVQAGVIEARFERDSPKDRSVAGGAVARAGLPDIAGVTFRRSGLGTILLRGKSFTLGSNVCLAAGHEASPEVIAHELRHVAQQRALDHGAVEFYLRYAWQYLRRRHLFYEDSPANTTFEAPIVSRTIPEQLAPSAGSR